MAQEWLEIWGWVSTRRMENNYRPHSSPKMDMTDLHSALPIFWAVAERNLDRARRRYLRACGTRVGNGNVQSDDGAHMPEPSDGERILV